MARRFCDALAGAALWSVLLILSFPGVQEAFISAVMK